MIDRLIEIGSHYRMEMNVKKNKVIKISRQPSTIKIIIDQNDWRIWNISIIWVS
jgi:hypothetical protein